MKMVVPSYLRWDTLNGHNSAIYLSTFIVRTLCSMETHMEGFAPIEMVVV